MNEVMPALLDECSLHRHFENEEIVIFPGTSSCQALPFLARLAPTLLPYKLVSWENMATYNSQLVLRQFGYDQASVLVRGDSSFSNVFFYQ